MLKRVAWVILHKILTLGLISLKCHKNLIEPEHGYTYDNYRNEVDSEAHSISDRFSLKSIIELKDASL